MRGEPQTPIGRSVKNLELSPGVQHAAGCIILVCEELPVRKCINVMVGITRSKVIFPYDMSNISFK